MEVCLSNGDFNIQPIYLKEYCFCFYTLGIVFIVLANTPAGYYRILLTSFTAGIWEHGNTGSYSFTTEPKETGT